MGRAAVKTWPGNGRKGKSCPGHGPMYVTLWLPSPCEEVFTSLICFMMDEAGESSWIYLALRSRSKTTLAPHKATAV